MSYWDSNVFSRIYRKWQKRISRHPDHYFQTPIEMARREYYQTVDSIRMVKGKQEHPQKVEQCATSSGFNVLGFKGEKEFKKDLKDRVIEQIKEETPEEDEIVHIGGMTIKESDWERVKRAYHVGSEEYQHQICAEDIKLQEYKIMKEAFQDGDEDA